MSQIARAIERIQAVGSADRALPELAKQSGVPYTTLVDWRSKNWRPKAVVTLERIAQAADAILAKGG